MNTRIKYLFFFVLFVTRISAQLLVSPNNNATALVNQIVGNNVTISNAALNCNPTASGLFIANNSNIGLNNGILLSTGSVMNAGGANTTESVTTCFNSNSSFFDPNISAIESKATYDGCVLEFDIVPICNTMQIRYVFGSEEYPEFVGTQYNDVFGFFISGPNPSGGSYSGLNIAKLPNGSPVAINTINNGSNNTGPCSNCSYYVDNSNGTTIQYDGFTTPLTASVNVKPCSTYHLKLAIADAGDCQYDSGVFLEYKGISCANNQIPGVASATTAAMCDLNNGTASASVSNYTGTPTYVWTPGGQTGATAVNLAPGTYTCTINFMNPCPYTKTLSAIVPHSSGFTFTNAVSNIKCPQDVNGSATVTTSGGSSPYNFSWTNGSNTSSASGLGLGNYICTITDASGCMKKDTVKIFATTTLAVKPSGFSALCSNATGSANSNVTGGKPPYAYSWNTTPVQTTSVATSLLPGVYSVQVTDGDGCVKGSTVTVNNFFPTITFNDSILNATCNQNNGGIFVGSLGGGTAPYQYSWSGGQTTANITGLGPGSYTLNVKDNNNCPGTKTYAISNFTYLPVIDGQKDDKCDQKKGNATVTVLGGSPPLSYSWSDGQTTATATNLGQGTYTVSITDAVGCKARSVFTIGNTDDVFNGSFDIAPREPVVGENFVVSIHPTSLWYVSLITSGMGFNFRDTTLVLNYSDYGNYRLTYYLTSTNGCKVTIPYDFFVKDYMTLYFPNTFTPNGDGLNDFYMPVGTLVKEFKMQVYNRWGELLFTTNDLYKGWDGNFRGSPAKEDVYVYKAQAKDYFGKSYDYVGHINLIR